MNLVDTEKTPLHRAYDMVKMEAEARGVTPTWSEIVGLVPERALFDAAARHIRLRNFTPEMVLEHKVRERHHGRRVAQRLRRVGRVADARRPAAAASPRTPARSARRSRRWSPASRSARRSTPPSTPRCASSRVRAAGSVTRSPRSSRATPTAYAAVAAAYKLPPNRRAQQRAEARRRSTTRSSAPPTCRSRRRARAPQVAELALAVARAGQHERRRPMPASPRCSPRRLRRRGLQRAHQRRGAQRPFPRRRARTGCAAAGRESGRAGASARARLVERALSA